MAVGDKLTTPAAGWRRYDDRHSLLYYNSAFRKVSLTGSYNGTTMGALKNNVATLEFSFYGSMVRIIAYKAKSYVDPYYTWVYIDGSYAGELHSRGENQKQTVAFEKTGLDLGLHTIKLLITGTPANVDVYTTRIDAIDIDSSGELRPLGGVDYFLLSKNDKFYTIKNGEIKEVAYSEKMFASEGFTSVSKVNLELIKTNLVKCKILRKRS